MSTANCATRLTDATEAMAAAGAAANEMAVKLFSLSDDAWVERIAALCHEVNRAYCYSIKDFSILPWSYAPKWQRDSAVMGVRKHLSGEITTPAQSHESWLAQKLAEGWSYGPTKNPDLKQHPCMVDYAQLPIEQRRKDHLFAAVVRIMAMTDGDAADAADANAHDSAAESPAAILKETATMDPNTDPKAPIDLTQGLPAGAPGAPGAADSTPSDAPAPSAPELTDQSEASTPESGVAPASSDGAPAASPTA